MSVPIAVVDDESLWLDLIARAMKGTDFEVVAAFTSGQAAIDTWPPEACLGLIDVELGQVGINGFDVARALRAKFPRLAIVFLTSVIDPWMVDQAAGAVASGTSYVLKGSVADVEELGKVLRATLDGQVVVDPRVLKSMSGDGPVEGLTPTQIRVMRLVATGWSNHQIADELNLSVKTVEATITRIARLFGVDSDRNVRVACVTRYLALAASGAHGAVVRD